MRHLSPITQYKHDALSKSIGGVDAKGVSLELLPLPILTLVFEYLQTPDLLRLCLLSRSFYPPAARGIYHDICIIGRLLSSQCPVREFRKWSGSCLTIIDSDRISALLETVSSNETLASMVRTLNMTKPHSSSSVIKLLLHLRLHSFACDVPVEELPPVLTRTLHKLAFRLPRAPLQAQNLRELKIYHLDETTDSKQFGNLALGMIELNSHRNLTKLVFEYLEERNLNHLNDLNSGLSVSSASCPSWIAFFEEFILRGIKLDLKAMGLGGNVGNLGGHVAQILDLAVELDSLQSLELNHTEHSHPGQAHSFEMTTFFEALTTSLPLLRHLSVTHTDNCLTCQVHAIKRVLSETLPHQLEKLAIRYEPRTASDSEAIEHLILTHQKLLQKLSLEDRSSSAIALFKLTRHLDKIQDSQWAIDEFYGEKTRRTLMPHALDQEASRPCVSEDKVRLIKACEEQIRLFVLSSIIYNNASASLPHLTEFNVLGLHFDMRKRGVFVNGETILLHQDQS